MTVLSCLAVASREALLPKALGDGALARLIAAAPPGEAPDAEEELYRRFASRARLYGLRHLRDEQAAADLAQQVLLLTLTSLRKGRVREPERLSSFVLGACRMTVQNLRRGESRRRAILDQFGGDLASGRQAANDVELDARRLSECLGRLGERERSVVVMTFYDEKTGPDVASELGLTPANVRVIRHRALRLLRRCMDGEGAS